MPPPRTNRASAEVFDVGRINPPSLGDIADGDTLDKVFYVSVNDIAGLPSPCWMTM